MKRRRNGTFGGLTRRDALLASGLALGGLALGGATRSQKPGKDHCDVGNCYPTKEETERYSYFEDLPAFDPLTPVDPDEMRITFLGSVVPPARRCQEMMSIFVQVGNAKGQPDQAVFDCGSGVCSNYSAMGIGWGQMNKIFISHLHGDHMSDLSFIYQSGPQNDRKTPLFVFGPGPSDFIWTDPRGMQPYGTFDDGTKTFCEMFRAMLRWQSEGFCFQSTGMKPGAPGSLDQATLRGDWGLPCDPVPVKDPRAPWVPRCNQPDYLDDFNDGYAVVPVELQYDLIGGTAYDNVSTGLKITHYPVVHTRRGAIGYKVEWNGLSMIYTSDTKPETNCIEQAKHVDAKGKARGVDVFIHEMAVPPEIWAMKIMGLDAPGPGPGVDQETWDAAVAWTKRVQDSSHTTQGAYGHLLSQIKPRPRLAVATHFITADDTVACALKSVQAHCPEIKKLGDALTFSFDLMVLRVYKHKILQRRAVVSDYSTVTRGSIPAEDQAAPKYYLYDAAGNKVPNPTGQIDPACTIPATNADGTVNYREDGY